MPSDLKKKIAARIKALMEGKPAVEIQGGPSRSYLYRILKGQNLTIEQLDAIVRAYGSNLGEFFEPWKETEIVRRQKLAIAARKELERILASDIELSLLVETLRGLGPRSGRE